MAASMPSALRKESHETLTREAFAFFAQPAFDDRAGHHGDRAVAGDPAIVVVHGDDGSLPGRE